VRKAVAEGIAPEEIEQVVLLALTTRGFPGTVAAWGSTREVLDMR
jgi:4-carboxymuconolactone decarboxylase